MTSLTETAYFTRRAVNIGIIALIIFVLGKVAFGYLWELWQALHPPPPPPPNVAFGILPTPKFPEEATSSASFVYNLETITGKFPQIADMGKVYFMPSPKETLLSLERAQELARELVFLGKPQVVTKTIRVWTDTEIPIRTLRLDIAQGNFTIKYDWTLDSTLFSQKELPNEEQAVVEARNYFSNLEIIPKEILESKTKVSFYQASLDKLIPVGSVSSADLVRVDFFRDSLDNLSLYSDTPDTSPLYIIFSGRKEDKKRVVEVHFTFWQIEKETFATYPLKSVEEAWNDLTSGGGYIASLGTSGGNVINVRKIYLAYYYPPTMLKFLEPVYVFEADKGFTIYVPAISKNWLETK